MNNNVTNTGKFFKGVSSQTLITIVMGILSIVSFSVFSRVLSKDVFGYFAALNAILVIFQAFSEAGLGSAVIQNKDCSDSFFSTAFSLSLIISFVLASILFISAPLLSRLIADDTICTPLRAFSILLITCSISSVGRAMMMKRLLFLRFGLYQIISYIVSYGIGILLAIKGFGLYSLVISEILNSAIVCLLVFTLSVHLPPLSLTRKESSRIISYGGWLTAGVLVNQITHQVDKLTLGKWLSVSSLGAYSRPSSFINQITERINNIFDTVLFPLLSSSKENTDINKLFIKAVSLLNSFSFVLSVIFFFNAKLIVCVFFGNEWLELVPIFRIISIGIFFSVDQRLVDCFFRSLALVKLNFYLRVFCLALMVIFIFVGSKFGVIGTACGVVFANFLSTFIKVFFLCRKIGASIGAVVVNLIKAIRPTLPIILVCTICVSFIKFNMLIEMVTVAFFSVVIVFIEFVIYPRFISEEYYEMAAPFLSKIKERIRL